MACHFFCDTGVIRGKCDPKDIHYESCSFFFKKYPINLNRYNVCETVIEELNYHKSNLISKANRVMGTVEYTYYRSIEQQIDLCIRKITKFNCNDHGASRIRDRSLLINDLETVIGAYTLSLRNDIKIVANSIIWSCLTGDEENILLTVDYRNLIKNYTEIKEVAEYCLTDDFNLLMLNMPDYCEYRLFLDEFEDL
ncbi:MAG: hypothetical protein FGO69_10625 [Methanobacterium sp.]|jgi:hypothetical protein|nr:MAG: hypothetical protein FGO69_10625 [Methanobacterium sp.]